MNLFELSAKISMDTKDYEKAVKNAVSGSKSLKENFAKLAGQSETNANKIKVLASQYDSAKSKVAVLTTAFNKAANEEGVTAKKTQELAKELADAEKKADDLKNEMDSLSKKTKNTGDSVESLSDKLKKGLSTAAKVATGVSAAGTAVFAFANKVSSTGDNIDKMSQKLGISAEGYQEWSHILQHCGASIDSLQPSMKTLATAAETGSDAFEKLGLSQKEISGMNQEELFNATIAALQNVSSETERTYLASKLLGRGATELGPLLNTSADDIDAMRQNLHDMGAVMSDEAVKNSAAFQDSLTNLKSAFSGAANGLANDLIPKFTELMEKVTAFVADGGLGKIIAGFKNLTPLITGAAAAMVAYKMSSAISGVIDAVTKATESQTIAQAALNAVMNANPFVLVATLIGGLVAAIITLWNTNDEFRETLINAWGDIKDTAVDVWERITKFFTKDIPNAFNSVINFVKNNWQSLLLLITNPIAGALKLLYDLNPRFREWVNDVWTSIKNGFSRIVDGARTWGKDLLDNFISGIRSKIQNLKDVVSNVAQTVKNFLGFSEPKEGPLSNFHTYAPDMMNLFIQGIRDNEKKLTDQIEKTFDFGERTITAGISYGSYGDGVFSSGGGYGARQMSVVQNSVRAAIHDEISKIGIYLDGNTLVGGISDRMNQGLGSIYAGNERRSMA